MSKLFCICKSGLPLSDAAAEALYSTARQMLDRNLSSRRIYHDDVEGIVRTDFESTAIGGASGIVFHGDVVNSKGETRVVYLVRAEDLEGDEDGVWIRLRRKKKRKKTR